MCLWRKGVTSLSALRVFLAISFGFDILKRCGEALKIAVDYMDVDDVSGEVGCFSLKFLLKVIKIYPFVGTL